MAKDEKDLEGDEAAAGGGGKKKLFIIIGAVVLLLLIGVGAAVMLMGGDEAPAEGEEAKAEEAEPVELVDPIYFDFKQQFVVSLPPGGRAKMLQISLQVMSRDQAVIDYINRNAPMLRHHLFNLFSTQDAAALYGREGREALAKAVEENLETHMKDSGFEGDVGAVYFSELVLQ
jgi:flagellar FliL protein